MKKQRRKRKLKKNVVIALSFISLIIGFAIGSYVYKTYNNFKHGIINQYQKKGIEAKDITVEIEEGSSIKAIAKKLKISGLIDNEYLFILKCRQEQLSDKFHYGTFNFNTYMNFYDIAEIMQNPNKNTDFIKLIIKEGDSIKDIAQNVENLGLMTKEEFLNKCDNVELDYDFIKQIPKRDNRLEGYLFPDTYFLSSNADIDEILNKILDRFEEMYSLELIQKTKDIGMTIDDVIIMASIIEKEVKFPSERSTVASVIFNRLKENMKLQMDCTVLYALGENKDRVLETDIQINSEYNTYYINGLPVGPISNAGIDCIKAVLNPEDTNYLYYVVKDDLTGEHFFTADYNEFLNAKQKYTSKFE